MKILNYTPHEVVLFVGEEKIVFPPIVGAIVRLEEIETPVNGFQFPMKKVSYSGVIGLPEYDPETILIVSGLVRQAFPERKDIVSPDSGKTAIRNEKGHIIAVKGFICN